MSRNQPSSLTPLERLEVCEASLPSDDEGGEGEDEVAALQIALQKVIKSRQDKTQQRQIEVLQGVQTAVDGDIAQLRASVSKTCKDLASTTNKAFHDIENQLKEKFDQIEACSTAHQQELNRKWEEYNEIYSRLDVAKQAVAAEYEKKKTALKRKISTMEQEAAKRLKEAETKLQSFKGKTSKLPDLAQMLKSLI